MRLFQKTSEQEISRTEYSLRNSATNLIVLLLNTAAAYVCRIIFVRTMDTEYLGVSGLFSNVLTMLSLAG